MLIGAAGRAGGKAAAGVVVGGGVAGRDVVVVGGTVGGGGTTAATGGLTSGATAGGGGFATGGGGGPGRGGSGVGGGGGGAGVVVFGAAGMQPTVDPPGPVTGRPIDWQFLGGSDAAPPGHAKTTANSPATATARTNPCAVRLMESSPDGSLESVQRGSERLGPDRRAAAEWILQLEDRIEQYRHRGRECRHDDDVRPYFRAAEKQWQSE